MRPTWRYRPITIRIRHGFADKAQLEFGAESHVLTMLSLSIVHLFAPPLVRDSRRREQSVQMQISEKTQHEPQRGS